MAWGVASKVESLSHCAIEAFANRQMALAVWDLEWGVCFGVLHLVWFSSTYATLIAIFVFDFCDNSHIKSSLKIES